MHQPAAGFCASQPGSKGQMIVSVRFLPVILLLMVLLTSGCVQFHRSTFPSDDWERERAGLSATIVQGVDGYVRALDTTGLMVIKHGKVVYEYGDLKQVSFIASGRKSVLSMLYGPYVASGKINLDSTLKDLGMSEIGGLLPIEERAKVIDLITARSGVYHSASNLGDRLAFAPQRGSQEPGTYWLYSNWDFNAAGAAFERMTHKDIYDALRDDLANPLGMQDFDRKQQEKSGDTSASQYLAYHMWFSTRDMARLGYLMLREGKWRNHQLIPANWVRQSVSVTTPLSQMHPQDDTLPFGYGYMWWVWDGPSAVGPYRGAYTAAGFAGQYITVFPALDMVVAHKTFWSEADRTRNVTLPEYFRLLDLIVGKSTASEKELVTWRETAKLRSAKVH
jgi:CubicO group peptidase (beta-lactamase class C family)